MSFLKDTVGVFDFMELCLPCPLGKERHFQLKVKIMEQRNQLTVSQEFFDPSKILRNISEFTSQLKTLVTSDDNFDEKLAAVPSYRPMRKTVEDSSYADLRERTIFIPEGLVVPYLDYQEVLKKSVEICEKINPEVLQPMRRWLAEVNNDPERLRSVRGASSLPDFNPHNVDRLSLEVGECFRSGGSKIKGKFKDYFARNKDVKKVYEQHDDLVSRLVATNRSEIIASVDAISELLSGLIENMEDDPDAYEFSSKSKEVLASLSFTAAQEVEFYGVTHYQMTALNTALTDTQEVLRK